MKPDIVVTRHKALVQYLKEQGLIDENTQIVSHIDNPDIIKNKIVLGVLPHSLSCLTKEYWEISLNLPPELRGKELSVEDIKKYSKGLKRYIVIVSGEV